MLRKIMIALASVIFLGAMAASTTAEARMGGFGGGFRSGGFHSAGFRGGMGFRSGFVGPRHFAFAPRFHRFAFAPRFHRFHRHRFAFAAVPFAVGAGVYASSCWRWRWTPWGWDRVWVCGPYYGYY
jgi:hypothetical protein